jgi:Uma2 family endonuclease
MSTQTKQPYVTPEEYLELERHSQHKHEYQRGLVYAMSGAKKNMFGLPETYMYY